jgi:hypothetical protein
MSGARHLALDYLGRDAVVYRNDRALPRAFMVYQARTCLDEATTLSTIHGGGVDFRREVLVAGCSGVPMPGAAGASQVQIKAYADDRVAIAATTDAAGYLVLTDAWFPGWRVSVDGVEQTVWRANHALRAVWLPAGQHDVEFRYVPAAFRWGLLLTLLSAVAVVGLAWGPNRRLFVGAAVVLMLGLDAPAADAKLGGAPFALGATPSVLTEGESLTISLDPRGARMSAPDAAPYDIYVGVSADSDYRRGWVYMSSTGAASTTAAPFRRTVTGAPSEALKATLSGLPPGYYFVRVQFVTSAAAATRKHYAYQPLWTTIRVNPRHPSDSKATVVAGLGVSLVAALLIVWRPPVNLFVSGRRWLRATG